MADTTVFVLSLNANRGKWSRYVYPFAIECFVQHGNDLLIRAGDLVCKLDKSAIYDDVLEDGEVVPVEFGGTVWWPYLDFGQAGVTKQLEGFDLVASGIPSISIGYDQRNLELFTAPYEVPADTLPGGIIPLPVCAPTFSVRIDFAPGEAWNLQAVTLFVQDDRVGT